MSKMHDEQGDTTSSLRQKNKLDKWFYTYETVYILACVLCRLAPPIKGIHETMLIGALSVISAVLIVITIVKRTKNKQQGFEGNIGIFALFTIMAALWCFEGEF